MSTADGGDRLACGRRWSDVLAQVADGKARDDHQQACPHCAAALAELGRLWAPVTAEARQPVTAPPGLVRGAMQRLRDVVPDDWYATVPTAGGRTRVAARVVAAIARRAATRVPGVAVALGRSSDPRLARAAARATQEHEAPGSAVGVAGSSGVLEVALVVAYGQDARALADDVRQAVRRDVAALAGVAELRVDVVVDDVLVPERD